MSKNTKRTLLIFGGGVAIAGGIYYLIRRARQNRATQEQAEKLKMLELCKKQPKNK